MDHFELRKRFTHHPPFGTQPDRYRDLRDFAYTIACWLLANTPESREQALAITHLEEAVFWGNAAVARREKDPASPPPPEPGEHQTIEFPVAGVTMTAADILPPPPAAAPNPVPSPAPVVPADPVLLEAIERLRQAGILRKISGPFHGTHQFEVDRNELARALGPARPS